MTRAGAHWRTIASSLTCRGFQGKPMFPNLVFAPPVTIDLQGDDPPREASEKTIAAIVSVTLKQEPS